MKILLASNNLHKLKEMRGIVAHSAPNISIVSPAEIGFSVDVEEHGTTFGENAHIKALALWLVAQGHPHPDAKPDKPLSAIRNLVREAGGPFPVLSDDSGVGIDALGGQPGLFSARFGADLLGDGADDRSRAELLLKRMEGKAQRGAHYTCNAVMVLDGNRYVQVQDIWEGVIGSAYVEGAGGFGYDPVFYLPDYNCTVSQLPQDQKDRISHRAKAVNGVLRAASFLPPLT